MGKKNDFSKRGGGNMEILENIYPCTHSQIFSLNDNVALCLFIKKEGLCFYFLHSYLANSVILDSDHKAFVLGNIKNHQIPNLTVGTYNLN